MSLDKQDAHSKPKKINRYTPRILAATLVAGLFLPLSAQFISSNAYAVDDEQTAEEQIALGDPIYGDETRLFSDDYVQSRISTNGLRDIRTWSPAVRTNATTSAYIDLAADKVWQTSRSENPATTFINKASTGAAITHTEIKNTTGSWETAVNGNLVAIGTNGGGKTRPRIIIHDINTGNVLSDTELPAANSVVAYVMAIAPDTSKPGIFWVGTYDPAGARLYRFNANNKRFDDFTPGKQWSNADIKYVRALAFADNTLSIGLGNPSSVWLLPAGDNAPHSINAVLGGVSSSTVYSQTAVPATNRAELSAESEEPAKQATEETIDGDAEATAQSTEQGQSGEAPQSGEQSQTDEQGQSGEQDQGKSAADQVMAQNSVATNSLFIAGTNAPASINVFDQNGTPKFHYVFPNQLGKTVDRIVADNSNTAWFTLRPSGNLYHLDLNAAKPTPEFVTATVEGAETRALAASGNTIAGVTGTRQLWKYDKDAGKLTVINLSRSTAEKPDTMPQGVITTPTATLVGGHWRYQVRNQGGKISTIEIPGEAKTQIAVGSDIYTGIYPSASLLRVNPDQGTVQTVASAENNQYRPRALVQNTATGLIYMASSSAYGQYGGGITEYNPKTGKSQFFATPVANQAPFALDAIDSGLIIGMTTAGEAVAAPANAKTAIVRWENGKVLWRHNFATNAAVSGVKTIKDGRGSFVLATTNDKTIYALDGQNGEVLWRTNLPSTGNQIAASGNYVLVKSGTEVIEYFPTRSALTRGKTLGKDIHWASLAKASNGSLDIALVTTAPASATRAQIASAREVLRVRGVSRYETALAASKQEFASANTAIIATGADFPDALCAGPLANTVGGPILLNPKESLRSDISAELSRLGVKKVYIAGGNGVVSANVKTAIEKKGIQVERLGGKDRFETSINIANKVRSLSGQSRMPVVATTGMVFPDALSATPAATKMNGAIVLTRENQVPAQVVAYLRSPAVGDVATVGGLAERAIRSTGIKPIWTATGKDRYDTGVKVANKVTGQPTSIYMATGADFPDGLSAGVIAARYNAPVVLTRPKEISPYVAPLIQRAAKVTAVGGTGAIFPQVLQEARSL